MYVFAEIQKIVLTTGWFRNSLFKPKLVLIRLLPPCK